MLASLGKLVGEPADGPGKPATGLHALVGGLSERMSTYDKIRERSLGALSVALPGLSAFGTYLWFVHGESIAKLLKGH